MQMRWKQLLMSILIKKAKGYNTKEKTQEYVLSDGKMVLTKKKVVTKHIPADINAMKAIIELDEISESDVQNMSDEQLEVEKLRLINMLSACDKYKEQTSKENEND